MWKKVLDTFPETMSCRFNPGGLFRISNDIMDNPGDSKYGMTEEQLTEAFRILKDKGVKHFGIHAFLASNTVTNEYYPLLAKILFELAVRVKTPQASTLPLSIFPAALAFHTARTRSPTISASSETG